jgi:hypothetical protein
MTMLENRTIKKFSRLMGGRFPSGMSFPNTYATSDYRPQALTRRFSEIHCIDMVRHFQCRRLQRKRTYMRISVRPDTAIPLLRNVKFPNKNALFERLETVPAISLQIQQPLHTKNLQRTRLRILRGKSCKSCLFCQRLWKCGGTHAVPASSVVIYEICG